MRPVVTPEEMKAIDRASPEPVAVLVERAGAAVARAALQLLGGGYGRRAVVIAGKGNNGADGRAAAVRLARRGVRVEVIEAADRPPRLAPVDLVIDAAYGTGFYGEYDAPDPAGSPVLAVDIPSGVNGLTGETGGQPARAARTVTFAAYKPGLVFQPGADLAGEVTVADIGLDTSGATAWVVEEEDVQAWLPSPGAESHKWKAGLWVLAGSGGMTGAANLCARAALRSGGSTVRLGIPGVPPAPDSLEVVGRTVPATGWDATVLEELDRMKALVVGPGLARGEGTGEAVRRLVAEAPVPTLVDADGLFALGSVDDARAVLSGRDKGTVLTPHDGEFSRMVGSKPGPDRLEATRDLARRTGATVLLKGSTTIVAEPGGRALISTAGDARLATAGTGDVLSGVIGAFLAQGLEPLEAAGAAAYVHGMA
ncbi:MAG: NAD(P)H-hydrate dehydratase, partial [Actinobacteria bacterium]|nr:NAD(P)H-hydrate dehydratase [Actinomycetota bacterium]